MSYNLNKSNGKDFSSGFSGYTPVSNQIGYTNKIITSYSSNSNIDYNNSLLSEDRNSLGNNRSYISGDAAGRGIGKSSSRGTGKGRRMGGGAGKGKGAGSGQGKSMGQAINIPNQFKEDDIQSDNTGSAIDKIEYTDLDIKIQKNPLDVIIEKLEEKSKKEQKKQHSKILNKKNKLLI